jgi:hypothetical protein
VSTGFADSGADLGSNDVAYLAAPRVAVIGGESVSSSSFGTVWHYFDERVEYPATFINADALSAADLDDYDVVVLPSGSYASTFNEARLSDLRAWIRGGGKLIAISSAARFLAGKDGFGLKTRAADTSAVDSLVAVPGARPYALRQRREASESVPGAFFQADVDPTHPLAYGFGAELPILRLGSAAVEPLKEGWNVGVLRDGTPISGFAGHETAKRLDGSLALGVEDIGRGTVVYMLDDPLFRGMWHAGAVLFGNAVFAVD